MLKPLACALLACICSSPAFADTCDDRKFRDLPDDKGVPIAWITPDFEIQSLGPSGTGKTSQRDLVHGDIHSTKVMDRASHDIYLTTKDSTASGSCAPFLPNGGTHPLGSMTEIRMEILINGQPSDDEDELIVVVDETGKVIGVFPKSKPIAVKPDYTLMFDSTFNQDEQICSSDQAIWNDAKGTLTVSFDNCD
ncbi:MAG: hypothetical protein CMK09_11685 [Ponticaulis sp.]|nr:hypothetical protein [Ponticaulis sp.]|tara:strand:+ start:8090 stop:8671 length:582 start_codon:yes stop_codon:yes gene_type:complete